MELVAIFVAKLFHSWFLLVVVLLEAVPEVVPLEAVVKHIPQHVASNGASNIRKQISQYGLRSQHRLRCSSSCCL